MVTSKKTATTTNAKPKAVTATQTVVKAAVKAAAKSTTQVVAKTAAKKPARTAVKTALKPAVKTVTKAPSTTAHQTSAKSAASVSAKESSAKIKKPKLVRDSFTMPKPEYAVIDELKQRAAKLGHPVKKSELLRAAIKVLAALPDAGFIAAMASVPPIKTGRPSKA